MPHASRSSPRSPESRRSLTSRARRLLRHGAAVAWDTFKATLSSWWDHHASRLAAAIAFYALLSLAPSLLVVVAVAGWVWSSSAAQEQLLQTVSRTAGGTVATGCASS